MNTLSSPFSIEPNTVNLFLIGYRGSGKSTVGPLLADRLGWSFIDADDLLEEGAGKTIRQIFAEYGETHFRDLETKVIADLAQGSGHVIATGGGVVLRPENRASLRGGGHVVWLAADSATLWERISRDPSSRERRPNLSIGGEAEVRELLQARESLYRETAHLRVDAGSMSPEEVVDAILSVWSPPSTSSGS